MPRSKYGKEKSSGLYVVSVPCGTDSCGKKKYKKIRAKTIALLEEKKALIQKDFAPAQGSDTLDDWFDKWLSSYKASCKESTRKWYRILYDTHISPLLGGKRLDKIREYECQQAVSKLTKASRSTQKSVKMILSSLFQAAVRNRLVLFNPAENITVGGAPPKKRRSLTDEERSKYLEAARTHPFGSFAAALLFLGLRRGEALALTAEDIRGDGVRINKQYVFPENNAPKLTLPKTAAGERTVPIPYALRPFFAKCKGKKGLLFADEDGMPLKYSAVISKWRDFITAALGEDTDVTMHYIRHTYCTMLFENGVDVLTAQHLMGHADIGTTMKIYTHYTEGVRRKNTAAVMSIGDFKAAKTVSPAQDNEDGEAAQIS